MKTIVEESRLYAESKANPMFRSLEVSIAEKAFKAGVEFAQHWISVEDELPDFDKSKYPNGDFEIFLVKMATGSINYKIKYCVANLIAEGRWSCEFDWNVVTHWRPIELK